MTDKQLIDLTLNGLYGGKLYEFEYNKYVIKMRLYNDKASISFFKNNKRIYHIYKELFIDAFGQLSVYIEDNESEAKEILENVWNVMINENRKNINASDFA